MLASLWQRKCLDPHVSQGLQQPYLKQLLAAAHETALATYLFVPRLYLFDVMLPN